jgi:hypothetical protein
MYEAGERRREENGLPVDTWADVLLAARRRTNRLRQLAVEHEHVWPIIADVPQDRLQVIRFRDHLHVLLVVEQLPQAAAHQRMVVGKNHTDGQRRGSRRRGPRRRAWCQLQM